MAKESSTKVKTQQYDPKEIVTLPISEIEVDYSWNSRIDKGESSGGKDESSGYAGLKLDLAKRGQDIPVFVRPNPNPKSKYKYSLMAGFRRVSALLDIAADGGNKNPTVETVVKMYSEVQARTLNVAENTLRNNLSGPDLAFGVYEIFKLDPDQTQGALASGLGKNQGYVGQLLKIMEHINPECTNDWRTNGVKLNIKEMSSLCELSSHAEQKVKYDAMLAAKRPAAKEDSEETTDMGLGRWVASHLEQAKFVGEYLARLQKTGYIKVIGSFGEGMMQKAFVQGKKTSALNAKASAEQIKEFGDAALKAFTAQLAAVEAKPEPKPLDEAKEAAKAAKQAKASANGKGAAKGATAH